MEIIKSLDNKKIKGLSKLLIKKYRDLENKFIVEGEHLVLEAYKAGVLLEIIRCPEYECNLNVSETIVTYEVLKKLSFTKTPQKIMGICKKISEKENGNKVLILDDIQDPGNLGTIIRSAVAFNVDTIVLSSNTVDLYNDKVLRSSEGMFFHINIIKRDINNLIKELKDKGYCVLGTKVDGGKDIRKIAHTEKMAIIVGNEGAGVKEEILDMCDDYLYIAMNLKCESLNVGVATSIILYELF